MFHRNCLMCFYFFLELTKYCRIIFIQGGQCSWVAKVFLVRGDVISLVIEIILIIIKQVIVYRLVGM